MARPRSRLFAATAVVAVVTALATCGRDTAAPHQPATLAVTATLPPGLDLASVNLTIDHARLIAVNSHGDTVFDQVFSFPANQTSLSLQADVPLVQSPETFQVTIQLLSGTVVLFSGKQTLSLSSGTNSTPPIPVSYAGPGQNVAALTLGPLDSLLTEGATLQFRVTAKDALGAIVPLFYVSWRTSDPVGVPIDATGTLTAPLARQKITVRARAFPDTTVTTSTSLQFIPLPSTVSFESGCAQSGLPGVQLPQPIVARVLDNDGLGVPGVTVQFTPPSAGGAVTPSSAVTDTGGRARTLVTLPTIPGPVQFQATVAGLTTPAVCPQTVLTAPPTQLAFKTQPATAVAGVGIGSFQVEERDANGALVSSATDSVTVAIANNAGGGTLSGPKTVKAVAGVATFTGLSLDKVGVGYTLQASASGLTSATSSAFDITPAPLNNLAFTTQPVNMTAGTAIPTVVVTARDAFGNTVTSFTGPVSLAFGTHPPGATLTGTASVPAVLGVATFSALGSLRLAGGYTLVASASGVGSTASNSFTVNPAPPVALAFLGQPTSGFAGTIISPPVSVMIKDSLGNIVTSATNAVTMGLNPSTGVLKGTLTRPPASGVATFTDLTVSTAATGYTLVASATGLASATSAKFDEIVQPPGVVWQAPVDGNWSNAANWLPARVPVPGDTVSIIVPGAYTVTLDVNSKIASLTVSTSTGTALSFAPGHNLTIDSVAEVQAGGVVLLAGNDTISGLGNLVNNGTILMTSSALTLAGDSNAAVLQVMGSSAITSPRFSNSLGSALVITGSSVGDGVLTIAPGFQNAGGIVLSNSDGAVARNATLKVSGVLTNTVDGSLQSIPGSLAGGARTLNAMLDNLGSVLVSQTLTIDSASATHGNSGTIVLNGGDLNVILSGTRPAFANESNGTIDVGTNKLVITNQTTGLFNNQPGGTLRGAGTINIGTASFITNGTTTVGEAGPGILQFVGNYLSGPDTTQTIFNSVVGGSPSNPGVDYTQFQISGTATLQGGLLNVTTTGPALGSYPIITLPVGSVFSGDFLAKHLPTNCTAAPSGNQYVVTCR